MLVGMNKIIISVSWASRWWFATDILIEEACIMYLTSQIITFVFSKSLYQNGSTFFKSSIMSRDAFISQPKFKVTKADY